MKISVVIPTYNRRELLARTLETLFAQDFPADQYEIIAAVDGSTDGTAQFLRSLEPSRPLRVIEHPRNRGQAAARNSALEIARGDLIVFIDDDLLCDPLLLRQHAAAHAEGDRMVVSGAVLTAPGSPSTLAAARLALVERHYPARSRGPIQWHQSNGAANISLPRALAAGCGGFDPALFRMAEDTDLVWRLYQAGARFFFAPEARAWQVYVKTADQLVEDAAWGGRNQVALCRKHPSYRPLSSLASLGCGPRLNRSLRALCARSPLPPDPLLKPICAAAERWQGWPPARRVGLKLLETRMAAAAWRGAAREAGAWKRMRCEFGMRLAVLLYHHVGPPRTTTHPELTISPAAFERHIRWLARRGYSGITAADWLRWRADATPLPPKAVLISFDDGYADLAEYALPVLRRYGFGAVVYIITGRIGGEVAWEEPRSTQSYKLMSAEEIRKWARAGIEFGAHSRTHPDLTSLGHAQLHEEIAVGKEDLERITGRPVTSFAYPFGYLNETVVEAVREHFPLAMTCEEGLNRLDTDPCLLRRTMVRPGDLAADVELRAALGWNPLERIRAAVRVRSRLRGTINTVRRLSQVLGAEP